MVIKKERLLNASAFLILIPILNDKFVTQK